jgi:predicted MFS family arabinose efflux permease
MSSPSPGRSPRERRFRRTTLANDPLWSHPDFMRLWSGRAVSQLGSQLSLVAIPLYAVLALDASPLEMGLLGAAAGIPRLLVGFLAGAWVDRHRRKPVMVATNLGQALAVAAIPIAALLGVASFGLLVAVEVVVGLLAVFFQAAWVPYIPGLVGRKLLPSANSRILASNSVAQVAGPSLAGMLVGAVGGPVTIGLNALSYLWSALRIARIGYREPEPRPHGAHDSIVREMRQGLGVLMRSPVLRALAGSHATIVLAGWAFLAVYPIYMLNTLDLSPRGVGLVYASGGVGALVGSVVTTTVIRRLGTGPAIVWSAALFGLFGLTIPLAVIVPDHALPLVVFAEFAQWLTLVIFEITEGSLRQAVTPDHLLGRVAASDLVLVSGLQPVGAFVGGVLGEVIGVQPTLLVGVAGMFCAGAWVWWSPIRHVSEMPTEPDASLGELTTAAA